MTIIIIIIIIINETPRTFRARISRAFRCFRARALPGLARVGGPFPRITRVSRASASFGRELGA